jgi:hypothetical protein
MPVSTSIRKFKMLLLGSVRQQNGTTPPPFDYGSEAHALSALGRRAAAEPIDAGVVAGLIALSSAVQRYHDTVPGDLADESRKANMLRLSAPAHGADNHLPVLIALATGLILATALFHRR